MNVDAFYQPVDSSETINYYRIELSTRGLLDDTLFDMDDFCKHVGRKPKGQWGLYAVNPTTVVWIPRNYANAALTGNFRFMSDKGPEVVKWSIDYARSQADSWLSQNTPPRHPWRMAELKALPERRNERLIRENNAYNNWYYTHKNTQGFASLNDFNEVVGLRPAPEFKLTRTDRGIGGRPLTRDNFVWITKRSVDAAKAGELKPPQFPPGTRSITEQGTNTLRFEQLFRNTIKRAKAIAASDAKRRKLEDDLAKLMDHITSYVESKGYPATKAMDPRVLPPEDFPKLNAARKLALKIMGDLQDTGSGAKLRSERLEELRAYDARKRAEVRMLNANNRVYTGGRGRPFNKHVTKKIRISDMTPEQRANHPDTRNLPPDQNYITIDTPKRKNQKVWCVEVHMPNPKLAAKDIAPIT